MDTNAAQFCSPVGCGARGTGRLKAALSGRPQQIRNRSPIKDRPNLGQTFVGSSKIMIARTKHQMSAYAAAGIAATSVFVVLYQVFRWLFIRYWEWQHDGRRMKFTFWADERALLLALLVGLLAFYLTLPMILSAVQRLLTNAKACSSLRAYG